MQKLKPPIKHVFVRQKWKILICHIKVHLEPHQFFRRPKLHILLVYRHFKLFNQIYFLIGYAAADPFLPKSKN